MASAFTLSNDPHGQEIFRRKFFQMVHPDDLEYPSRDLARSPAVQQWLFSHIFDEQGHAFGPHARYRFRVLKKVMLIIINAFENPEEDAISDDLANCLGHLATLKEQEELDLAQQVSKVTYTVPSLEESPPTIKLVEKQLMRGTGTDTGLRTWTAALFLATYLCNAGQDIVKGKSIIELGGGAGFLSILCGTHLEAKNVLITDSSPRATELAQYNIDLNNAGGVVQTALLEWGTTALSTVLPTDVHQLDIILAADILYYPKDIPALVSTLAEIFGTNRKIQLVLAHTVRSEETLDEFLKACDQQSWHVKQLDFARVPGNEQTGFFHTSWTDEIVNIYKITLPDNEERKLCTDAQEFLDSTVKDHPTAAKMPKDGQISG
ncbi:MAG: hypothetical protein Q9174_005900 [Haloplaca sp. 1 TL-2023]